MKFLKRWPPHPHLKDIHLFYVSIVLLSLAAVLLAITLSLQLSQARGPSPSKPYATGQLIRAADVDMRISDVHTSAGQIPFMAPAGQHYLIFDFWIKNLSSAPINVLPSSDMYLKNNGGDIIYLTPFTLDKPFRAGEVPAGEAIHGQLSFLTQKTGEYKLFVDAKWSGAAVSVLVQKGNN